SPFILRSRCLVFGFPLSQIESVHRSPYLSGYSGLELMPPEYVLSGRSLQIVSSLDGELFTAVALLPSMSMRKSSEAATVITRKLMEHSILWTYHPSAHLVD